MNKIKDFLTHIVCQFMRYFPIRHEAGLMKIGNPGPDSPVFISGDYFSTAKRVIKALRGQDCYLLIVDSAGINVWCAAGVGDLNEHKIADAVNAAGLHDIVKHRTLIIPQLAAVGVDRKKLHLECGFHAAWGPANLYDLGAFIRNNCRSTAEMRLVRFAFRDRLSLALGQLFNYYFFYVYYFAYTIFFGTQYNHHALFIAIVLLYAITSGVFIFLMPFKWPPSNIIFASIVPFGGSFYYAEFVNPAAKHLLPFYLITTAIITVLICMDMIGSTVFYKTTIGNWLRTLSNRSLFQPKINDNCTLCGECNRVCPKGLFSRNGKEKMNLDLKRDCCECLACVKQCPSVAIENINKGIYKHDIKSISDELLQKVMY